MMRHWATYLDRNYLDRAKVLHASMVRHCGDFQLHVLAWDDEVEEWAYKTPGIDGMHAEIFIKCYPELERDKLPGPPRSMVEHYWTCGPQWVVDVMDMTGEPVTYVDADIMFHSSPEPVFDEIGAAPAAVFPHNFANAIDGLPGPTRESHDMFGKYNVGLVHFGDAEVAEDWARECREWCYDRIEETPIPDRRLRYGDQKFLDSWQGRFGAHVVEHPGAELGPWAVHTQPLDVVDGVIYFGERPLVAYHYSSFKELPHGGVQLTRPEYMLNQRQAEILYAPYIEALAKVRR